MHMRRFWSTSVLILLLAVFAALPAMANLPPVLDLEARLISRARVGKVLLVTVTPHRDALTLGRIEVVSGGDAVEAVSDVRAVSVEVEKTARMLFDIEPSFEGTIGTIQVRWVSDFDADAVIARTVYIERKGADVVEIEGHVHAAALQAKLESEQLQRDQDEARARVNALLARGEFPARITGDASKLTAFERAWNEHAKPYAREVTAASCGIFNILSPRNYTFPLNGNVGYTNYIGAEQTFRAPGYSVTIET
ncbi:MAG: hypothetical protein QOH21_1966, partial [Acidobacteriota bacterium]|nr:hypothetical protein [Acidobacteriota bacterium]